MAKKVGLNSFKKYLTFMDKRETKSCPWKNVHRLSELLQSAFKQKHQKRKEHGCTRDLNTWLFWHQVTGVVFGR